MRTRLAIKTHALLERWFPERRLFLKSDTDTRFIRLKSETQFLAFAGGSLVVAWAIVATAVLLMDSIGSGNFREQAKRDRLMYEHRLNLIASERDSRATEALDAQKRFNTALEQVSAMQTELLASEIRRNELATGIEVIQTTLRDTMKEREAVRKRLTAIEAQAEAGGTGPIAASTAGQADFMADVLARTAAERDQIEADAKGALDRATDLENEIALMQDRNDRIFRQLEEALTVSVEPLDRMFRKVGMSPERMIETVRNGYSGQGGPLTPIAYSTRGEAPNPDEVQANRLLGRLDELNLYRIAAEKLPLGKPVHASVRFTSPFGVRRDPKTGGRRMHKGVDFAGPTGTDIFATGDGVVTHAGWRSGFGKLVIIQHAFGIESRYAHNTRILVKKGQRVSRGDHISDMGSTGRSTGTHVHYEVRVNGKPVNPMTYIKAAKDVF